MLIPWPEFDSLPTKDAIASLLRQHNIKGSRGSVNQCPIAIATGWHVGTLGRWKPTEDPTKSAIPLTSAETDFILDFDDGYYPNLDLNYGYYPDLDLDYDPDGL